MIIKLVDWIAVRSLLLILGLCCAELTLRVCGLHPWSNMEMDRIRERFTVPDSEIGWALSSRPRGQGFTGLQKHSETILENKTRLVIPTPADRAAETILVIGDSTIFGWGLNDEETFPSLLAAKLPKVRVINAAVPGYGALQATLWMERLIPLEQPRYVILGYADYFLPRDTGDLTWAAMAAENTVRNNISLPYGTLKNGSLQVVTARPYFLELPGRGTLALAKLGEQALAALPARARSLAAIEIEKAVLQRFAQSARDAGAVPLALFWSKDNSQSLFGEYLKSLQVELLSCVHPRQGDPSTVVDADGHPNAEVTRYWAECAYEHLAGARPDLASPP